MIYLILILGFILRLISLNQSLWLDEATTALVAQMSYHDFFTKFMPADFHPPLYYLVIHCLWMVIGGSEIALRIPSVIFGVLTIYVVYLISKEFKMKYPYVAPLFLATSGLHIYYSQEARMYSMVTLLVCYLVLSYLKKNWVLFSIVLPMLFLTDYLSLLIFPVLLIYTLLNNRKNLKKILISTIPLVLTVLAWLPIFSRQLIAGLAVRSDASGWWNILGPVTFKNVALIPTKFIIGRVNIDNKLIYLAVIILISFFFAYIIGKAKNKIIWYWFGLTLFLGILISFLIPTLTYFRYLFVLPAFYLLLAESKSKVFIAGILMVNIFFTGRYLFNERYHRENWREIANVIGEEKVVFPADSQKEALVYYRKGVNIISKNQVTNDQATIWLSRYVWNIFDPTDSTRKYLEDLGYNWSEELNLNGVVFWKYTK